MMGPTDPQDSEALAASWERPRPWPEVDATVESQARHEWALEERLRQRWLEREQEGESWNGWPF